MEKKWDAFISHATEDKDTIVRELSTFLEKLGLNIWYDEFSLTVGDSLSKSIDEGLLNSNFGIVIISKDFIQKKWTDYEYRSLLAKDEKGRKIILPIWHNISSEEIKNFSLYLSDIIALDSSKNSVQELGIKLTRVVKPEIYENISRYLKFKELIKNGTTKTVKRSELIPQEKPQSKLSKQQIVRVKNIHFNIGQNFDGSLEESIYNYELDLHPEREIQSYEIMNACYLEFIKEKSVIDTKIKREIAIILLGFSLGQLLDVNLLSIKDKTDLYELWKINYYEY